VTKEISLAIEICRRLEKYVGDGPKSLHEPIFIGNETTYLQEAIESTNVATTGRFIKEFENKLSEYLGSIPSVAVVNGTAALHLALEAVGVCRGDEVLVPSLTFIATVNAVAYCGASPVALDVNADNLGLDAEKLETFLVNETRVSSGHLVNKKTGARIAAIVVVHTLGHIGSILEICKIAAKYSIPVVEDAAESIGSKLRNVHAGGFGVVSTISFNGNKTITSGGGGAVVSKDESLISRIRHKATTAKLVHKWEFRHDSIGYNYRMPNLNAALALAQLEQLDEIVQYQRQIHEDYNEMFSDLEEIQVIAEPPHSRSNYWLNALKLNHPSPSFLTEIFKRTDQIGIATRPFWNLVQDQEPYERIQVYDAEQSRALRDSVVCLPSSPALAIKGK
jgi:perosamine synthetase